MPETPRKILVLGAYGLIGTGIVQDLQAHGYDVLGFGRSEKTAQRVHPNLDWRYGDLRDFEKLEDWSCYLAGVDGVVNAAGALQDGPEDDLRAVHVTSINALAQACAMAEIPLVQISAAGVHTGAQTAFFRTKAEGDAAVRAAGGLHWILRPGLVLAPSGYGGTALLRMLAAVPFVQPIALGQTPVQCIGLRDLAGAVRACLDGRIAKGISVDLVSERAQSLSELASAIRSWLGFAPARYRVALPRWVLKPTGWIADGLGRLGWRSPLRSNALATLEAGISGDPKPWAQAGGPPIEDLAEILARMPARSEDRISARMSLLMPLCVATLAVFWLLSGLIGLVQLPEAAKTLIDVGWSNALARTSVGFWAMVDIALALAILHRKTARAACLGMIAVCLIYMLSASFVTPALWLDPLGPLVKILPAMMLSLTALALLETR